MMAKTTLVEELYAGNPHVWSDEGEVAPTATPRRGSLLYKNVKNLFGLAGAGFVALMISGCAFNPVSMPVEPRDNVVYEDVGDKGPVKEQKFRLAIYVSQGDYSKTGDIAKSLDSSLTSALADFAFFQIVDRSSAEAVQQEKFFSGEDVNADMFKSADVIITAKLNGFNAITESESYDLLTKTNQKKYTVSGSVDFDPAGVDFRETDRARRNHLRHTRLTLEDFRTIDIFEEFNLRTGNRTVVGAKGDLGRMAIATRLQHARRRSIAGTEFLRESLRAFLGGLQSQSREIGRRSRSETGTG